MAKDSESSLSARANILNYFVSTTAATKSLWSSMTVDENCCTIADTAIYQRTTTPAAPLTLKQHVPETPPNAIYPMFHVSVLGMGRHLHVFHGFFRQQLLHLLAGLEELEGRLDDAVEEKREVDQEDEPHDLQRLERLPAQAEGHQPDE